ncbi:MAG: hypothetical protein H0U62_03490 [Actinobacteria bacterium]|nr:hypothetical protein [Actinomycetota bacterium]
MPGAAGSFIASLVGHEPPGARRGDAARRLVIEHSDHTGVGVGDLGAHDLAADA